MTHYFVDYEDVDDTAGASPYYAYWHLTAGDSLFMSQYGSIIETGDNNSAIYVDGYATEANITIQGTVYGTDYGITSLGQYANFTITGQVMGDSVGMSIANTAFVYIGKTGLVSGGTEGLSMSDGEVVNDGTIHGGTNDAVQLGGGILVNNGLLSDPSDAIFYDGEADARVTNTGTIQGNLSTWYGATDTTVGVTIDNSGNWDGDIGFVAGGDTVTNTGRITGDVSLGTGDDTLDSHNGFIGGTIDLGDGTDVVYAGAEDNVIAGGKGADVIYGGGGNNTASYQYSTAGVRVDLTAGTATHGDASGDQLHQIQSVYGSILGRDVLTGDNGDNLLYGFIGNDRITGNGGNDSFLQYGTGTERLYGGDGNDHFQLYSAAPGTYGEALTSASVIDGGNGFDTLELTGVGPVVFGSNTVSGIERILFDDGFSYSLTSHNATVANNATLDVDASALTGVHTAYFNGAAETGGKFTFEGGAGDDTFIGGGGTDTLAGGDGIDTLTGGGAADVFAYDTVTESRAIAYDSVTDFTAGTDHFQLDVLVDTVDATQTANASPGNLATRVHTACQGVLGPHDAVLVQITAGTLTGHTFLVVDADGAAGYQAATDYLIDVTGISGALTAADFTVA